MVTDTVEVPGIAVVRLPVSVIGLVTSLRLTLPSPNAEESVITGLLSAAENSRTDSFTLPN